jgi:phosphoenolpyruvate carboxylase
MPCTCHCCPQVQTFGLSLMKLDIRQESTRHAEVRHSCGSWPDYGRIMAVTACGKQQLLKAAHTKQLSTAATLSNATWSLLCV